jgi:hypothetical protein
MANQRWRSERESRHEDVQRSALQHKRSTTIGAQDINLENKNSRSSRRRDLSNNMAAGIFAPSRHDGFVLLGRIRTSASN